jgi:hypothetical protein
MDEREGCSRLMRFVVMAVVALALLVLIWLVIKI